jgi:hypothetical protein
MSATGNRAAEERVAKPYTLRSLRADAVWTALPARDQHLLLWLLAGDVVTAQLASLLVYGSLRVAQRRLARLVEYGLLRGFWTASAQRPRGRYAYALTRAARSDLERLQWPEGPPDRPPALPASPPIHQLATNDLLAAFLRAGRPERDEGLVAWAAERAAASCSASSARTRWPASGSGSGPWPCSSSATSAPSAARSWPRRSAATGRCSPGRPGTRWPSASSSSPAVIQVSRFATRSRTRSATPYATAG